MSGAGEWFLSFGGWLMAAGSFLLWLLGWVSTSVPPDPIPNSIGEHSSDTENLVYGSASTSAALVVSLAALKIATCLTQFASAWRKA